MILAAGLGTRLRPLTDHTPKALIKIGDRPLLESLIVKLVESGIQRIVINVHHHADQVRDFVTSLDLPGADLLLSDECDRLLDTGGAIKKASPLLNKEPFLLHNVDVLSNIDLVQLAGQHLRSASLVTLAVTARDSSRYLLFDQHRQLAGWGNRRSGEKIVVRPQRSESLKAFAFSGIHVIDPKIFRFMPQESVFPILPFYLKLAATQKITCFDHSEGIFMDIGKPDALQRARQYFHSENR